MNKYLILGALLLALIIGYVLYTRDSSDTPVVEDAPSSVTMSGTITGVDNSKLMLDGPTIITATDDAGEPFLTAVPSMGLSLCPAHINIADVSLATMGDRIEVSGSRDAEGYIVPCDDTTHRLTLTGVQQDAELGYEFSYRKGPDGYQTLDDDESTHGDFVRGLMLVNAKEYEEFSQSTEPREGPPAMHVHVYRNTEKQSAAVWSDKNALETSSAFAFASPTEAVVGGANAVHFVADGLYPVDTYVIAHGEHIYLLLGAHLDTASPIYKDFQSLVSSLTFIPLQPTGIQGKLDVKTVCEGTLAYMTFANGDEADAFVAECIAGEHPEVIDRYVQDLGVDGASI